MAWKLWVYRYFSYEVAVRGAAFKSNFNRWCFRLNELFSSSYNLIVGNELQYRKLCKLHLKILIFWYMVPCFLTCKLKWMLSVILYTWYAMWVWTRKINFLNISRRLSVGLTSDSDIPEFSWIPTTFLNEDFVKIPSNKFYSHWK